MAFDEEKYLQQFETKEEIESELRRLQRNLENINLAKPNYWQTIWHKKRLLLEKFTQKYCTTETYQDDLGRYHSYYKEIGGKE